MDTAASLGILGTVEFLATRDTVVSVAILDIAEYLAIQVTVEFQGIQAIVASLAIQVTVGYQVILVSAVTQEYLDIVEFPDIQDKAGILVIAESQAILGTLG